MRNKVVMQNLSHHKNSILLFYMMDSYNEEDKNPNSEWNEKG